MRPVNLDEVGDAELGVLGIFYLYLYNFEDSYAL